jgi:hypothetical protein
LEELFFELDELFLPAAVLFLALLLLDCLDFELALDFVEDFLAVDFFAAAFFEVLFAADFFFVDFFFSAGFSVSDFFSEAFLPPGRTISSTITRVYFCRCPALRR